MIQRVQDLYKDTEFEELLEGARMNAANDWEESFVADMKDRYTEYGRRMFISDAQKDHLERIANDEYPKGHQTMNAPQDFRQMTAETVGKDILQALVMELKLLPKPWQEIPQKKQDDIIDRLRSRVDSNIKMAVHLLASQGRTVVAGDLDQITIKDGVKAVVKFGSNAANLHELYDVAGKAVLVVVANAADHTGGMDEVKGESDQRAMDLGHEYHDNDGGGMEGAGDGDDVVDAEFIALPSPDQVQPSEEEKDQAFDDGYAAAEAGKPESDCPVIRSELVIEWMRGHRTFHEADPVKSAKLGELPNDSGVYTCEPDELIEWGTKKDHVEIKLLELENGKWLHATKIQIGTSHSSGPLCLRHGSADSRDEALRTVQSKLVNIYAKGEDCGLKGKDLKDFTDWVNNLVEDEEEVAA